MVHGIMRPNENVLCHTSLFSLLPWNTNRYSILQRVTLYTCSYHTAHLAV